MKNFILKITLTTCFYIGIASFCSGQILSTDDFEKKYMASPQAQLVDVRTAGEFGGGHLPKAVNIDFKKEDFEKQIQQLDKTKPIFVYCLAGGRSGQAVQVLQKNGFKEIYDLQGGYLKWTTKLKPVEGAQSEATAQSVHPEQLKYLIALHDVVILDFYAPWCGPCVKMMPIVDKLAEELKGKVHVMKINADANKEILTMYGIDEIPSFLVFKKGLLTQKATGLQEEATIKKWVE